MKLFLHCLSFALLLCSQAASAAEPRGIEFFEKQIRPILVERCQSCHGEKRQQGGLRLTNRADALQGGDRGPAIVPGKPAESILVQFVEYSAKLKMPPKGKLPDAEIAKLKEWVARGAVWPESGNVARAGEGKITDEQRRWWAFQPIRPVTIPNVRDAAWARSPIDRFILAELEKRGLIRASAAERRVLIRRATFDLTGLPPTHAEVDAFLADKSDHAFATVVDRLLASPAYGQRWARHWLDVVRYADFHDGDPKARTASCEPLQAWRYRDWVVNSFNRDLPFDRFVVHQIAGDTLPSPEGLDFYADGLVASTFLTNGSWDRGDADKEKMVSDMVDDNIDTVGKAFLGLTLGCARCHDHKLDPLLQTDYYALAGIFYSTHLLKDIGTKGGEYTVNRVPLASKSYVAKREAQLKQIAELNAKLASTDKKQTPKSAPDAPDRVALVKERDKLQNELLAEPPVAEAAEDGGTAGGLFPKIQDVPIHIRGSYTRLGAVVPRRMPVLFAGETQKPIAKGSGRRELADWIASKDNPLTARVLVNRVWQGHFGAGLVNTPNNFGLRSEPPSHPELLDWLAATFIEDGWSLKKLHRRIMLSATYRQSSVVGRDALRDPENRWLGRFAARRLEAESIRDTMLVVSGRLDRSAGGPAYADVTLPRRSLYYQTARWDRSTFLTLFDAANPDASDEKRNVSTVAPQALFLVNHEFVQTQAKALADRLVREVPSNENERIERAFQLLFSRSATQAELAICRRILANKDGWRDLAHVLLCSNELVYLD